MELLFTLAEVGEWVEIKWVEGSNSKFEKKISINLPFYFVKACPPDNVQGVNQL